MATVARENIGLLNDKITIKLSKEDYLPVFEKKVKEYSKTMNVPGFRKGMVPPGMVKKMYGASIYTDEVLKTVEKELMAYLQTEQPDIFAQPIALESDMKLLDFNTPDEYEFAFEIGLKPTFELAALGTANITQHKVAVSNQMVQEEVERMQVKAGSLTDLEIIQDSENILTLLFTETDAAGIVTEGGIVKETTVPLKNFTAAAQEEFKGLTKDATITKQLNQCLEGENLAVLAEDLGLSEEDATATEKYFQISIVKIGQQEKSELNEEFYAKIFPGATIATEEEFRTKLKEEIQQYWDGQSRNQLHDQLYHYLLDHTNMEFPAGFLMRWLQTNNENKKTAAEAEAEFPTFSGQLKWTLISDRIIKENSLDVSQEELKAAMRAEIMQYFGGMSMGGDISWLDSYVDRMLKDEKQVESTYRRMVTDKLFSWAQGQVNATEKIVTPEELTGMQHHH
jgi:trigger factor